MTTKTILTALLLSLFFGIKAQEVARPATQTPPIAFESVSFSTLQGSITITCSEADKLTNFEFVGQNAYFNFEWDSNKPADCFPMKLGIKPGKVTIKYRMRGGEFKTIELKLTEKESLNLEI
jgi:hypothetical protein